MTITKEQLSVATVGVPGLSLPPGAKLRVSYALRRVPNGSFSNVVSLRSTPQIGDIALAQLEKVGKNAGLELTNGRRCTLHEGDLLAVVFGSRYATHQFEGYALADGDSCDLLSMGGLCGLVKSKHASVAEPTKLRLLGNFGDADGRPLRLRDFALPPAPISGKPRVVVVCGSSMDAGKTYTAMSLVKGLRSQKQRVAAIKLTGTAAGRDTWSMLDAGAEPALNFIDGGYPSTYQCTLEQLLDLYRLLCCHAAAQGADWVVIEIADGLNQGETAAILRSSQFTTTVDAWLFATGDPIAAVGGVQILRDWGIDVIAISGVISQSPLAMMEVEAATHISCITAKDLQQGKLNSQLVAKRVPTNGRYSAKSMYVGDGELKNGELALSAAQHLPEYLGMNRE